MSRARQRRTREVRAGMDGLDLTVLPAAVSPLVAAELTGTPRRCRVLAAFPTCLYVALGAHERVLAVLASDAVALPIGLRLALPSTSVRWGVEAGDRVVVGQGRVRLPRADVVGARLLRPARVSPSPRGSSGAVGLPDPGVLGELAHALTASALAGQSVEAGVRGLIGVGQGLTPSGDDALCGVLLTLGAVEGAQPRRALSAVRTAVREVLPWTTSLSAALLVAAGQGYAVPDVARLVTRLVSAGPSGLNGGPEQALDQGFGGAIRPVDPSREVADLVEKVLAIGHTSGRDLLSGVSGALRAVDAHLSASPSSPQEGAHRG